MTTRGVRRAALTRFLSKSFYPSDQVVHKEIADHDDSDELRAWRWWRDVDRNAANGEFGDMIEFGILDPTKVTRSALQNAASIAGLMITTEAMVAEAPKKEEPAAPGGGMGGMGGMDF